jgi:hypothetical protein
MKYSTFKALADELVPIYFMHVGKKEDQEGLSQMVQSSQMSGLLVQFDDFLVHHHIMTTFGTGHSDTLLSYWFVVDAINSHPNFKIEYLKDYDAQRQIAHGFQNVSSAGFNCCARA